VESFLRDAERILETAAAAAGNESPRYVICVSRTGSIRILSDVTGWSLPALALEMGAAALYQVERRGASVQVEGWSYGRKCVLSKDTTQAWWSQAGRTGTYATIQLLESSEGSQNDREPQVRNS
jgi:hypothetical protein